MLREIKIFLAAFTFLTRIPIPWNFGWDPNWLNACVRWFPIVGLIIGCIGSLSLYIFHLVLPLNPAIVLSMLTTLYITGAFHEDGFADTCDGFGGGYEKNKILHIMKDSRLGTYGTVGLIGIIGLKYTVLQEYNFNQLLWIIPIGHMISRIPPIYFMASADYVQEDQLSKSKPLANSVSVLNLAIVTLWLCSACFALYFFNISIHTITITLIALILFFILIRHKSIKKIGGFTGDVLGAMQQVCELCFYLTLMVRLN
jgi:adenosylcobinamide-GDP ribazoletransferase